LLRVPRGLLSLFDVLSLEEALLRADSRNWCVVYRGGPPTIVMGVSGDAASLVDCAAARAAGVPVLRRFTGGGTVVTDEGTAFASFVVGKGAARGAPLFPRDIMTWSARVYAPVLRALCGDGGGGGGGGFALRDHDYVLGDRKIGGNAQAVSRDRWVHHTSFLWDARAERLALLRLPPKRPAYRGDRAHADFLTLLKDHVRDDVRARGTGADAVGDALIEHLRGDEARGGARVVDVPLEEALKCVALNDRKSNVWVDV
jgi:lipoate-protein ligase A